MPNINEVIKGLQHCTKNPKIKNHEKWGVKKEPECEGCPNRYTGCCEYCLMRDSLALLKEQQKIVQCNKCKYGKYDKINQKYQCEKIRQRTWFIIWHDGDFFCKDGEPKDGEQE